MKIEPETTEGNEPVYTVWIFHHQQIFNGYESDCRILMMMLVDDVEAESYGGKGVTTIRKLANDHPGVNYTWMENQQGEVIHTLSRTATDQIQHEE